MVSTGLYIFQHHGVVQLGSHEGLQVNVVPARGFLQHESRTGLFFLSEQQSFESTLNIIQLPNVFHVMTGPCECLVGLTLVLLLRLCVETCQGAIAWQYPHTGQ